MAATQPETTLVAEFSAPDATPTPWSEGEGRLRAAELYWISTVRADGRPHVTPLIAVWQDGALHFCTGGHEQKARNLEGNPHVVLTTGSNAMDEGLDVVLEGEAVRVTDEATLRRLAGAWVAKYGEGWRFGVDDGAFTHADGEGGVHRALVFRVEPAKVLGFAKGVFAQTRWRFER